MSTEVPPIGSDWGHATPRTSPAELADALAEETQRAVDAYNALPDGPEPCNDKSGYERVSVTIPVSRALFDQLMNGATGYRAHYAISVECGEWFNRRLVDAVAPIIANATHLYADRFTHKQCHASLLGSYAKFWYSRDITDPAAEPWLKTLVPALHVPRWRAYWESKPRPWKGLLVPLPTSPAVLLNGTFLNGEGEAYEQKPTRSKQIFDSGWT
jgi:hypothetical protein